MYRLMEVHKFQFRSITERDHVVDLGVDGKMNLKWCEIN